MEEIIRKCLPTYTVVGKLGEGLYGSVFRIRDRFKERAAKVVPITVERSISHRTPEDLDSKISRDFHSVRQYYETVKGKGVIDVYDFHLIDKQVSEHNARAYLVVLMALYPDNLQNHVLNNFPLDPDTAVFLMTDLAHTLERLSHPADRAFLVTDLKPSNLLLSADGRVLIGDLGGLKRIGSVSTAAGSQFSPSWCAPEVLLRGEQPQVAAAIYSYGLVAYFIWEGRLPYEDEDFSHRPRLIAEQGLPFTRQQVPDHVRSLIRHCLAFDTADRMNHFHDVLKGLAAGAGRVTPETAAATGRHEAGTTPATVVRPRAFQRAGRTDGQQKGSKPRPGGKWIEPRTGMIFIKIPGTRFKMGCLDRDDLAEENEKPCHTVEVDDFWMGKYPVTQLQWQSVMGGNPSHFKKGDDYPVEQVSWTDAVAFANKLTGLHGGKICFRLPTEAQWEFAARSGGMAEIFSGGDHADVCAWYKINSQYAPHPVGEKAPNGLGIHDMSGNVLEWCADIYLADAYSRSRHPAAESTDSRLNRVVRGGSWTHAACHCRTTARRGLPAGLRYTSLGLRMVRVN